MDAAADTAKREAQIVAVALKAHVECPICTNVPRDGVMLQCVNGHNVCNACKDKLGWGAKCPMGRCDFSTPPAKNFTVTNLVESFPFKWQCRHRNCKFEGTRQTLRSHESSCRQMVIQCPDYGHYHCHESITLGTVVSHFGITHKRTARPNNTRSNKGSDAFVWEDIYARMIDFSWTPKPFELNLAKWALLCAVWHGGQVNVWLWAFLGEEEAEKLECRFGMANNGLSIDVLSAVYPLTRDRESVLRDDRCLRLSPNEVSQICTKERLLEDLYEFVVNFEVSRKS